MINIYNFDYLYHFNSLNLYGFIIVSLIFLSIGSFAASLIHRLSSNNSFKGINIFFSRSQCPKCSTKISLINLIPIFGFILQKTRCKKCNSPISYFYPVTELIFLIIGLTLVFLYGNSIYFYVLFLIFFLFYSLFILDWKLFYLPLFLNFALIFIGFTSNFIFQVFNDYSDLYKLSSQLFPFYGFIIGYFTLWIVNLIFKIFFKKDGIGGGDFLLFAGIGSIFGPFALPFIMMVSSILGCLIYLIFHNKFHNEIPLGSCLILGTICYFILKSFELFTDYLVI